MLKKLRRRYVAISMSIISLVLVVFYIVTGLLFFISFSLDMNTVLQKYASASSDIAPPQLGYSDTDNSLFAHYSGTICVVEVKEFESVAILDFSRADMDENILADAVAYVLKTDNTSGHISRLNLFYHKAPLEYGFRVAFADSTQYYEYMKTLAVDGGILMLFSMLVLFFIMRFLATMCLKPVEKAWAQQKDFIADASHELKTPLTVILTNSGILKAHKDDMIRNQLQWINSTDEEASYMKELVDKLLLLAKTDNMSQKNMFDNVNLSDITLQLALQYEPIAFEKGIILNTDIDKDIVIKGDQVALMQIVHILLDNAVKYSGQNNEVTLSLKKRQHYSIKGSRSCIYLTTRNYGDVIPADEIPHLFDRFYRSDKSRTSGNGYGLGLSICKNLAQLHNADINVSSDEKNGTVFSLKFTEKKKHRKQKI